MKQLDPKAIWIFFFRSLFSILIIGSILVFQLFSFFVVVTNLNDVDQSLTDIFQSGVPVFLVWILFCITVSYLWSKLVYKYYKYDVAELGFKKESGVIFKKYVTIPYDRIQNVDIYRGILSRILGLSDLHIQTAGLSTPVGGAVSEGRLPGLSKEVAEQLRDELIIRSRQSRGGQGL